MNTIAKPKTYTTLVNDITELYNRAHHALVEAYWQIGRLIVKQEQEGAGKEVYTKQLIERLSEDLSHQFGSGFSKRNLYKMRRFYLAHQAVPTSAQLTWSQHVELLPVKLAEGTVTLEDAGDHRQTASQCPIKRFYASLNIECRTPNNE